MKTFHRSLIILLFMTPMICVAQVPPQKSPSAVASEFYTLIIREDPSGLPDVRAMQLLRPYLSRSLLSLFNRVRKGKSKQSRERHSRKSRHSWKVASSPACTKGRINFASVG